MQCESLNCLSQKTIRLVIRFHNMNNEVTRIDALMIHVSIDAMWKIFCATTKGVQHYTRFVTVMSWELIQLGFTTCLYNII